MVGLCRVGAPPPNTKAPSPPAPPHLPSSPHSTPIPPPPPQSADVWSAGVVLYLMLSGKLPFMGANDRQVCAAVLQSEIVTEGGAWDDVSDGAKSAVRRMLCRDPKARATPEELLAHPWLARDAVVVAVAAAQAPHAAGKAAAAKAATAPAAATVAAPLAQPQLQHAAASAAAAAPSAAKLAAAAAPHGGIRGASRSFCAVSSMLPPRPRASELRSISASAAANGSCLSRGGCGGGSAAVPCAGAAAALAARRAPVAAVSTSSYETRLP
jgi:hypothetical protein